MADESEHSESIRIAHLTMLQGVITRMGPTPSRSKPCLQRSEARQLPLPLPQISRPYITPLLPSFQF